MTIVRQLLERKGRSVFSVDPDAPVLEALRAMATHQVGALLVMSDGALRGILSERDYARKVILLGRASADTPVRDIMTSNVVTVQPDTTVQACMQLMTDRHIRHLPVTDGGKVVGMVSIGDLVKAVIAEQRETIEQLESYIHR
jgi:CBS domain-containing protein